jgi:hypothetical protein
MCVTLGNAAEVFEYRADSVPRRSYTETMHHVGYLGPGDLWRPTGGRPHIVTEIRSRHNTVIVTDQLGQTHHYPADALVPTAVRDPLILGASVVHAGA